MAVRRLYRSSRERILGGVAGGLADYFNVDPTLVRLLWIVAVVAGGFGLLAYIIAWVLIPETPKGRLGSEGDGSETEAEADDPGRRAFLDDTRSRRGPDDDPTPASSDRGYWLFGVVLVGLGAYLLIKNFVPWFSLGKFWPVAVILLGILVLAGAFRTRPNKEE